MPVNKMQDRKINRSIERQQRAKENVEKEGEYSKDKKVNKIKED